MHSLFIAIYNYSWQCPALHIYYIFNPCIYIVYWYSVTFELVPNLSRQYIWDEMYYILDDEITDKKEKDKIWTLFSSYFDGISQYSSKG